MRIWGRLALMVFCRRLSEGRGAVSSRLNLSRPSWISANESSANRFAASVVIW